MLSLGEAVELSPNASVMLRIATLSAWAELQVMSKNQTYLVDVVKPYRPVLAPLWVACLRDYASVRADSEVLEETSAGTIDSSYSSLGKEVLLPVCCRLHSRDHVHSRTCDSTTWRHGRSFSRLWQRRWTTMSRTSWGPWTVKRA